MKEIKPDYTKHNQWQKIVERKSIYNGFDVEPVLVEPPEYKTWWYYALVVPSGVVGVNPLVCSIAISDKEFSGENINLIPEELLFSKFASGFTCLKILAENYKNFGGYKNETPS